MSVLVLWLNIPLCVLAFGLMTGVPLWMVLRHPDRSPAETRSVPAYIKRRASAAVPAARRPRVSRAMVPSIQL